MRIAAPNEVCIAIVGKYVNLIDSYKSLNEALVHGGTVNDCRMDVRFVDSERIEQDGIGDNFEDVDGIIVPGGFESRGIEGMILAVHYARPRSVPFLGICLDMQTAVIEFARNVCQTEGAYG